MPHRRFALAPAAGPGRSRRLHRARRPARALAAARPRRGALRGRRRRGVDRATRRCASTLSSHDGALAPAALDNGFTQAPHGAEGRAVLGDAARQDTPRRQRVPLDGGAELRAASPDARTRRAPRSAATASRCVADAHARGTGLRVTWRAMLRDGSNYVREELRFESGADLDLAQVALLELDLDKAWNGRHDDRLAGDRRRPLLRLRAPDGRDAHRRHARAAVRAPRAAAARRRAGGLLGGVRRRARGPAAPRLHGLPRERARHAVPHLPALQLLVRHRLLHALHRAGGRRRDRGVRPQAGQGARREDGLVPVRRRLGRPPARCGSSTSTSRTGSRPCARRPSAWAPSRACGCRPGAATARRARSGWPPRKAGGYEVDDQGLALSGPKYYALFHDATLGLLKNYGINQFKLDGTGSPDKVTPGSAFDSDFAAAIALIGDLRAVKPDLFINLTTGTWPSPFWLRTADSIWRGGEDHEFAGVGTQPPALDHLPRRRYLRRYRAAGPLYPLNSLMLHGIIYARKRARPERRPGRRLRRRGALVLRQRHRPAGDVRLARPAHRAQLGRPGRRAPSGRARNAATLRDSHWIGGDPGAAAGLRLGRRGARARRSSRCAIRATSRRTSRSTSAPRWSCRRRRRARGTRRPRTRRRRRGARSPRVGRDSSTWRRSRCWCGSCRRRVERSSPMGRPLDERPPCDAGCRQWTTPPSTESSSPGMVSSSGAKIESGTESDFGARCIAQLSSISITWSISIGRAIRKPCTPCATGAAQQLVLRGLLDALGHGAHVQRGGELRRSSHDGARVDAASSAR